MFSFMMISIGSQFRRNKFNTGDIVVSFQFKDPAELERAKKMLEWDRGIQSAVGVQGHEDIKLEMQQ